jgi:hypothetical protein
MPKAVCTSVVVDLTSAVSQAYLDVSVQEMTGNWSGYEWLKSPAAAAEPKAGFWQNRIGMTTSFAILTSLLPPPKPEACSFGRVHCLRFPTPTGGANTLCDARSANV